MKCPNCGAEIGPNSRSCEYCGAQITYEMRRSQEQVNKQGCPKCGSSNVTFRRENQGEIRGKNSRQIIHRTVGFCKDCGHTWYTSDIASDVPKKNTMIWWILGWIFFFPAPVMVLIWRKKNTWDIKKKIAVTVVFWLLMIIIGSVNRRNDTTAPSADSQAVKESTVIESADSQAVKGSTVIESTNAESQVQEKPTEEKTDKPFYENGKIVDLMNGTGTKKISTISVVKADQAECTEEGLLDWYFNYVKKNADCNYHIIVYNDVPDKGVYALSNAGFIQKDISLIAEKDGSYFLGDDAGSTIFTVDESTKTLKVDAIMADAATVENAKAKVDAVIPEKYKGSQAYSVDIAGEEGRLDCSLTLISDEFADADYQTIAADLGKQIKDLNLGIGYFNIAFQTDDYTVKAISSVDDLSTQDVSEIGTTIL